MKKTHYLTIPVLLIACAHAMAAPAKESIHWVGIALVIFLILQTLLIIGLQRSRLSNKRAKKALKESQKALEQRIHERSESLHQINNLLIDEVSRHEATGHQLRETKEYLQSMINSMPSIIIGVTAEGKVTHWNAAAEDTFEIFSNEALGRNITTLLPLLPINQETITGSIREGDPYSLQYSLQDDDESKRYFDITIYPLISMIQGAVIRVDDVTQRIIIENMMIQNEKMYSLGEVAAGIAHEINNPLSVILQNVQNIIRRIDPEFPQNKKIAGELDIDIYHLERYLQTREIYQFLHSIRDAGERSATIVTNMLEFSRSNHKKNSLVDIQKLIDQSILIYSNIYSAHNDKKLPEIITDITQPLPLVNGSAPELQQVLLNLLRNAKQALLSEEQQEKNLHIIIKAFTQEDFLVIEVHDNGPGMTDNIKRHIFEPFFTTKAIGSGTGLGLSISYFIITEHHHGTIDVKSTPGKGSTFIIKLPLLLHQ